MTIKCIAFHSYKGGTGKTTIASNCAALLAKRGFKVALLDLDVYAPSLLAYFQKEPKKWLNDYLIGEAEVDEVMTPVTDSIQDYGKQFDKTSEIKGKLWIGFCNVKKEEVYKIEAGASDSSKSQLRRFILLREYLFRDYDLDYVIIDTSPGIRYWSINALAVADTLFLTLKMGDIDVEGTKRLASEIYGSLTKYGTRSFLLFNRVSGYCLPSHTVQTLDKENASRNVLLMDSYETDNVEHMLSKETKMDVISAIPCYCDIQFSRKEFLTALRYPTHPFTKQLELLVNAMATKL
ncbi:MAG TPA: ParA family protein [Nitrososphaera sp.]|nr:ParA family protein [Nitrososphaera sp.]